MIHVLKADVAPPTARPLDDGCCCCYNVAASLQVTSSALALVTHQVGMHCRERGFLLAHIWNLHLGLQEFQMEQLELHGQALRAEKRNLEVMDRATPPWDLSSRCGVVVVRGRTTERRCCCC